MGQDIAVQTNQRIDTLITSYGDNLAQVMPKHVDAATFIGLAVAYVRRDEYLVRAARANPLGLILALRECAALGHMPAKGTCSLVAYGNVITCLEEVGGVIERMYRSGGVRSVHVEVVRDKDQSRWQQTEMELPYHRYDENASREERGPLKAVYAYAKLLTGDWSQVIYLNRHDMEDIRAMSKSATAKPKTGQKEGGNFWGPPWPGEGPNTRAMWRKSALHRLERFVPTSAAYRWEIAQAAAAAARDPRLPDAPLLTPDYVDGGEVQEAEIVPEKPAQPAATAPNEDGWPETAAPGGSKK